MSFLPGHRKSVLLEVDLTELPVSPDADDPLAKFRARGAHQLGPTLRALHDAADNRNVGGLIAKVGGSLPWAGMQELRLGVQAFKASGKPTLAWAETFDEADMTDYVLATGFDEIWLQPGGGLGLLGVGMETTFLRGALDRLGIEPQLQQRHEFKNAADQVLRHEFTEAHRLSLSQLAESLYQHAVSSIAAARNLEQDRVRDLINTGPRTATEAHDVGLVDSLGYRDQAYDAIRSRLASAAKGNDGEPELLFADRWEPRRTLKSRIPFRDKGYVASVEVRGTIVSGHSRRSAMGRQVGSDSIGAALRAAAKDDNARAVLLRIDSPGGSAVASDTIWREVCRVQEAGKPVVASMGATAASGGYYIACPADVIFALPATLTGSIGVFGGKLVTLQLLEKLGLSTGSVSHGARSLMFSARRRFTDDEQARLAVTIDAIYDDFVSKVALGRKRPVPDIEAVARGRVWTGADALDVGLVDQLGGQRAALVHTRARADLPSDAPLRPAIQLSPLARLRSSRNSEDPRAQVSLLAPAIAELCAAAGLGELAARLGLSEWPAALGIAAGATELPLTHVR